MQQGRWQALVLVLHHCGGGLEMGLGKREHWIQDTSHGCQHGAEQLTDLGGT